MCPREECTCVCVVLLNLLVLPRHHTASRRSKQDQILRTSLLHYIWMPSNVLKVISLEQLSGIEEALQSTLFTLFLIVPLETLFCLASVSTSLLA